MNQVIRITSWNSFGDIRGKISDIYSIIFPSDRDNILLAQEGGSMANLTADYKYGHITYKSLFAVRDIDNRTRCTTGILADASLNMSMFSGTVPNVNRPVVIGVLFNKLMIVTLHATAYHRIARNEIGYIDDFLSNNCYNPWKYQWILMGDMNVNPEELVIHSNIGEDRIIKTGKSTQASTSELDYAIISRGLVKDFKKEIKVGRLGCGLSDHWPVYIDVDRSTFLKI